jgi:predicted metal-dependent peptidase
MDQELIKNAELELSKAIVKLLRTESFYAHIISNLTRKIDDEVPTMAVSCRENQIYLIVNPSFLIEKLTPEQRIGVLKHEVLHLVLKHLFRGRKENPFVENLAADIVVNQFVSPWPLPTGAVYLTSFPELNLDKNQSLEYYYNQLLKLTDKDSKENYPNSFQQLEKLKDEFDKENGSHKLWSNSNKDEVDRIINKLCKNAKEKTDLSSWGKLPNEIKRTLDALNQPPELNWKNLIRIFSISCGRTTLRATHRKESKRFEGSEGSKIKRLKKIVVAIDTSGSIDDVLFSKFWSEIVALNKTGTEIMVIQCDADIHSIELFKKSTGIPQILGGGGTSFDPVFEWLSKNRKYNGLIYFTDGYAPSPTIKLSIPTLWCVYGYHGEIDHLPGKVIKVK